MFRTGNPTLRNQAFQGSGQTWPDLESQGGSTPGARPARPNHFTLQGAVNKTAFTLALCVVTAVFAWNLSLTGDETVGFEMTALGHTLTWGGMIVGLVLGLIIVFVPRISPILTPLYAIVEGFFVGGISAFYAWRMGLREMQTAIVPDADTVLLAKSGLGKLTSATVNNLNTEIIFNAVLLTFGIAGGLLAAYSLKLIRPNRLFYNITIVGTLGVCLYGGIALIASLFGSYSLASVYSPDNGGMLAIGFSFLVVGLASMNLVLDFDIIANAARNKAPKYMEWYGAFGILVTLVWLYISLLRLLAQLQARD